MLSAIGLPNLHPRPRAVLLDELLPHAAYSAAFADCVADLFELFYREGRGLSGGSVHRFVQDGFGFFRLSGAGCARGGAFGFCGLRFYFFVEVGRAYAGEGGVSFVVGGYCRREALEEPPEGIFVEFFAACALALMSGGSAPVQ